RSRRLVRQGLAALPDRKTDDSAYRLDLHGIVAGNLVAARYSRVGPLYGDPNDPGIVRDREEVGLDVSRAEERWNYRTYALFGRDALAGAVPRSRELLVG